MKIQALFATLILVTVSPFSRAETSAPKNPTRGILVIAHGVSHHGGDHGDDHGGDHGDDHGGGHGGNHGDDHTGHSDHQTGDHTGHGNPDTPPTGDIDPWETTVLETVTAASTQVDEPVELAFGMWDQKNFQAGVDRLVARGVTELRVVPLFVSSHSEVIRAQYYQFHLTETNPLPFDPGRVNLPTAITSVTFSPCLDDSPVLSEILKDRAKEMTADPTRDEIILVAHGPVTDEDDRLWIGDLLTHATRMTEGTDNRQPVHVQTLRDDAPTPVRDEMTRRLRETVKSIQDRGHRAVLVPVLLAAGGIEKGIEERLQGLEYALQGHMIAPDARLTKWIVQMGASRHHRH